MTKSSHKATLTSTCSLGEPSKGIHTSWAGNNYFSVLGLAGTLMATWATKHRDHTSI